MKNIEEIKEKIKSLILEVLEVDVEDEDLLLEEEILDSISILYIVTELEDAYKLQIPLDDVTEKNFKNVESIANLILSIS